MLFEVGFLLPPLLLLPLQGLLGKEHLLIRLGPLLDEVLLHGRISGLDQLTLKRPSTRSPALESKDFCRFLVWGPYSRSTATRDPPQETQP